MSQVSGKWYDHICPEKKNLSIIFCYHFPDAANSIMTKWGGGFIASTCVSISHAIFALVLLDFLISGGESYREGFSQDYEYTATAVTSGLALWYGLIR